VVAVASCTVCSISCCRSVANVDGGVEVVVAIVVNPLESNYKFWEAS